jgi:hypothetical protein
VEHIILSLSPRVRRAGGPGEFTERPGDLFALGEPLEVITRRRMEAFLGYDLGEVRIHRGYQAEEASHRLGARAFTFRKHIFAPRQNLDTSTAEGLGLLAHELTHTIQQTQPHRMPQGQMVSRDTGSPPAAPPGSQSDAEMVLLAPARSVPLTTSAQLRESQARANEQLVEGALADNTDPASSQIDLEAVAYKVYRLMKDGLVIERERAAKPGGY